MVPESSPLPTCCGMNGKSFGDGPPRCSKHFKPGDRELIAESDRQGKGVLLADGAWPYGPNVNIDSRFEMIEWAESNGLRLARRNHLCPRWLKLGACRRGWQCSDRIDLLTAKWCDHMTPWKTLGGEAAVLVFQPYELTAAERMEINALCAANDLTAEIREGGWYLHGAWFIGLWSKAVKA